MHFDMSQHVPHPSSSRDREMTYSKSSKRERRTYSKSSKTEKEVFKIQQHRVGGIQNPAREREGGIQNPATQSRRYSKSSKRGRRYSKSSKRERGVTRIRRKEGRSCCCREDILWSVQHGIVHRETCMRRLVYRRRDLCACTPWLIGFSRRILSTVIEEHLTRGG